MTTTLIVHPYNWTTEENQDDLSENIHIHAWCLDEYSQPHLLRFETFPVYCMLELPTTHYGRPYSWDKAKVETLFNSLSEHEKARFFTPTYYVLEHHETIYFYKNQKQPMVKCIFPNPRMMYLFENFITKLNYIEYIGKMSFKVHESRISPIRKLLTLKKCRFSQWFSIQGVEVEDPISSTKKEYLVDYKTLTPLTAEQSRGKMTYPGIMAFDIECYAKNHLAMPHPLNASDTAYMNSVTYWRLGQPDTRKRYLIIHGECNDIEGAEVIRVQNELDIQRVMGELILKHDPEVITGYNILSFDYWYLDQRLKRRGRSWGKIGRILTKECQVNSMDWASSGAGQNSFHTLEMDGRITIDLLPMVKRDYKLDTYGLNNVAKTFLKKEKHDVDAKTMFKIYEGLQNALRGQDEEEKTKWIEEMTRVARYCIQDSELVVDLFEKFNAWISLIEMSNIVGVTIMDIFTRGQQIRCVSQVVDLAHTLGYVIDKREVDPIDFEGGFVGDPIPGLYENVLCFDFASLYPSIMQAYNICFTTLVPPENHDKIPDDMCHTFRINVEEMVDNFVSEDEEAGSSSQPTKILQKRVMTVKFVKREVRHGILPQLVANLVAERRAVRKQLETEEDPLIQVILDKRQLALKVSANSMFGFLGVQKGGKLPLIEGAMSITAKGRELIGRVNDYLRDTYGAVVVYNDTDSSMVDLHLEKTSDCNYWGHRLAKELTDLFPPPLKLEFEKAMRILCIRKKKYAAFLVDDDGHLKEDPNKILVRGIVLSRRDNCVFLRKVYRDLLYRILKKQTIYEIFDILMDAIHDLMSGNVSPKDLSIVRSVSDRYKSDTFFMKVFSDELAKIGKKPNGGDRLEYVVVLPKDNPREPILGKKMRLTGDYILAKQNGESVEELDIMYYLEHMLQNPLDQLFETGFVKQLKEVEDRGYIPPRGKIVPLKSPLKILFKKMEVEGHFDVRTMKQWFRDELEGKNKRQQSITKYFVVNSKLVIEKQ